jgi:hypothetical protein
MAGSFVQGKDPGGSSELGDEPLRVVLTKGTPSLCSRKKRSCNQVISPSELCSCLRKAYKRRQPTTVIRNGETDSKKQLLCFQMEGFRCILNNVTKSKPKRRLKTSVS